MGLEYLKSLLKITVYISLLIQGLTGIFNIGILGFTNYYTSVSPDVNILVEFGLINPSTIHLPSIV